MLPLRPTRAAHPDHNYTLTATDDVGAQVYFATLMIVPAAQFDQ